MNLLGRKLSPLLLVTVGHIGTWGDVQASPVVEKSERYELNWSTGKIRFYGTAMMDPKSETTWRSAEQRAWSEGLNHFQSTGPQFLHEKFGFKADQKKSTFTKPVSIVSSVNTVYFGDSRVKVTLETQLEDVYRQTEHEVSGKPVNQANASPLIIKLSNKTSPVAIFSVVDESGKTLASAGDMAASHKSGASMSRWFKSSPPQERVSSAGKSVAKLAATVQGPGVLRVNRSDWRDEYQAAIASGQATLILP